MKGNRVQVILECTEQKTTDVPGTSRYITVKNKKNSLSTRSLDCQLGNKLAL